MKWLFQNNFTYDEYTFVYAVGNINLGNIKWLLKNKFPYDTYVCKKLRKHKIL